jgi:tripartite-type tricarboxylate transporter receptor subunit TctC
MRLGRRRLLQLSASAAAYAALPRTAGAESYPVRPVRIMVGFPPGGTADILARLVGQRLSERLGQPFVIENRPGANTNLATEAVVKSDPDGYTLLLANGSAAANATLYEHLNFNFIRDITPVASIDRVPLVMEVNPAFPAKTVAEFIDYAKANPGKVNVGATGSGTTPDLAAQLFIIMTGVDVVVVQYRGSAPSITDLLGGQVQVMFDLLISSMGYIRSGQLRPLALTTASRSDLLAGIPTVGETVTGYEASSWQGLGVPLGTPAEIIEKLNKEINSALEDPKLQEQLAKLGATPLAGSPNDFGEVISTETQKWAKVIHTAHIKPE